MSFTETVNIIINQGTDFSRSFAIINLDRTARDLTGYTGNANLKKSLVSDINTQFSVNIYDPANGIIEISLTNDQTSNISFGRYLYDILITSNTNAKERVVQGIVELSPGITK